MQDDFQPGGADSRGRKPKIIAPLNDLNAVHPAIESFTDDDEAPRDNAAPVSDAASDEPANAAEATTGASDPAVVTSADVADTSSETPRTPADKPRRKFPIGWPPSKRDWLIIATCVVLLIALGGALYSMTHRDAAPVASQKTKKKAKAVPKVITSTLTGLPVADASVNQRPVTGVMIENSLDARPQSGLDQAGVVFEAVAEGGVTRFFAVFQDTQPDYIGPIRSARPYYVQWCMSFDCAYAHVGGSPDGLADIKTWATKDLDQFANSGAYHRISSRYAPHNVYSSISAFNELETSKGYGAPKYTGFSRKADQPYKPPVASTTGAAAKNQDTRAVANSIDFTMSGAYYDPHFDYDPGTNSYKRSEAGQPHMEQHADGSQVQIAPKVVIGMIVPLSAGALDAQGAAYSNYQAVGSGDAIVFQDGTATAIHWSKSDIGSPLSFTDASGKPFKLDAGQTWITAITDPSKATYK